MSTIPSCLFGSHVKLLTDGLLEREQNLDTFCGQFLSPISHPFEAGQSFLEVKTFLLGHCLQNFRRDSTREHAHFGSYNNIEKKHVSFKYLTQHRPTCS